MGEELTPILMALTDFFRINMPYGLRVRVDTHEIAAFNREYAPLGCNKADAGNLLYTKYDNVVDVLSAFQPDDKQVTGENEVTCFFYNDNTNPTNSEDDVFWNLYLLRIRVMSHLRISSQSRISPEMLLGDTLNKNRSDSSSFYSDN